VKSRKLIYGLIALVVLFGAWYAFRPERAVVNATVNESFPTMSPGATDTVLAGGTFHSVAHKSAGTATLHQLPDGKRILRLTDFSTSNGPDVRVYLGMAPDANDAATVKDAGYVELGSLKGNIGDQNYDIPSDVDLSKIHSVTIWCKRFAVNFATAPLTTSQAMSTTQN
jgi:hypothetical protein